jgi:hypothetical protein
MVLWFLVSFALTLLGLTLIDVSFILILVSEGRATPDRRERENARSIRKRLFHFLSCVFDGIELRAFHIL